MTPPSPATLADSKRDALRVIDEILTPLMARGFHGTVPLALELHGGLVTLVTDKGPEQTHKIVGRRAK